MFMKWLSKLALGSTRAFARPLKNISMNQPKDICSREKIKYLCGKRYVARGARLAGGSFTYNHSRWQNIQHKGEF